MAKNTIRAPKKLIEVALPLDAINTACAREKSIRHGHPSTLHLWWARRPLAAARAVIFAQMVNDPGYQQGGGFRFGVNKEKAKLKREEYFRIIEDLVKWENTNNEEVLERARNAIWESWRETCELNKNHPQAAELFNPDKLPGFHDPFAGGGAIPLEAQRLGLESHASDLNPVAVTINKAMIEIPPRFANLSPTGPIPAGEKQQALLQTWKGAQGLAEDVRRYGLWMIEEAKKRIGHLYPQVEITEEMALDRPDLKPLIGQKLTVIAWLWARTVKSPNPAFSHIDVPLVSSFILSSKKGKEAYIEPVIDEGDYHFKVKIGSLPETAKLGTSAGKRAAFKCLLTGTPISYDYIRTVGKKGNIGQRLMAIVAEGKRGRVYLPPTKQHQDIALKATPDWAPAKQLDGKCRVNVSNYGKEAFGDLFTARQLTVLTTFSRLLPEVIQNCRRVESINHSSLTYGEAIVTYLAFVIDKCADYGSNICSWHSSGEKIRNTFGRQAIPMTWDFAEVNPFCSSSGSAKNMLDWTWKSLSECPSTPCGSAYQTDAQLQEISSNKVVSTDPPYYDNIDYADLSDFFYVWLRQGLRNVFPTLYATMGTPKVDELVAAPYRHKSKKDAELFFLDGMKKAIQNLAEKAHPAFPVTIYYAFKQSETKAGNTTNTGWETFLQAVIDAGFAITGTWPMRTELSNRMIGSGTNALASSIVLVCRKRQLEAETISRRQFIRELNSVLPDALAEMTRGGVNSPVAPVDLSQAIIGPGMEIFSQYAAVLEANGEPMSVHTALQLINRFLTADDFDSDTLFCLDWFTQHGWANGSFGDGDVLARAKGTSVDGLVEAGVATSSQGNLQLIHWRDLPADWDPSQDNRLPQWEALHHLIRLLNQKGTTAAGAALARIPMMAEPVRTLAYRLYTFCEQKGWAEEARAYNELATAWNAIEQAATEAGTVGTQQTLDI